MHKPPPALAKPGVHAEGFAQDESNIIPSHSRASGHERALAYHAETEQHAHSTRVLSGARRRQSITGSLAYRL